MDGVSLALTEVATISVRRSPHLVGGALGLPARLVTDPSRLGLLMVPASAAGLLSEARLRATAASRESVPVDVMEDHVAMSAVAARQVLEVGAAGCGGGVGVRCVGDGPLGSGQSCRRHSAASHAHARGGGVPR